MKCSGCSDSVNKALSGVDGVESVEVSLENQSVKVVSGVEISKEVLADVVSKAGYSLS